VECSVVVEFLQPENIFGFHLRNVGPDLICVMVMNGWHLDVSGIFLQGTTKGGRIGWDMELTTLFPGSAHSKEGGTKFRVDR
jgi:hypothetical protein